MMAPLGLNRDNEMPIPSCMTRRLFVHARTTRSKPNLLILQEASHTHALRC